MYKLLLIFGISFLFCFYSCDKTDDDKSTKTYFKYKNTTSQNIEIQVKEHIENTYITYILQPNEEKIFESICEGEGKGVCGEFIEIHDVRIKFLNDNKCLTNFSKIFTLTSYDNYTNEMYNNYENTLLYLIDAEEVNAATTCN